MFVAVLLFTQTTVDKLAAHSIKPDEVRQVANGDRIAIPNPHPRVADSILLIGPTYGGRILTIVLNPEPTDPHTWHVRTAWPASFSQRRRYQRGR